MAKRSISALMTLLMIFMALTVFPFASNADDEIVNPFIDVPDGAWFTDGVLFCKEKGYISGTSETTFSPNMPLTRAMFVTILSKVAEADTTPYSTSHFNDVQIGKWYSNPIEWAFSAGYASGTGGGNFSPDAPLTRETLAQFLYTFSKANGRSVDTESTLDYYNDAILTAAWAKDAVTWAVDFGLISGTAEATLSPKNECSRAQIALIIKKYVEFYASSCAHNWTSPTCTEGRVCTKCGYTRGTPLGHDAARTCTEGAVCRRCEKQLEPLGHIYKKAPTCTEGADCVRCGTHTDALGHLYTTAPSCTNGADCLRCGAHADALGHNFVSGKCSRCGITAEQYKTDILINSLKKNGKLKNGVYTLDYEYQKGNMYTYCDVKYDAVKDKILLVFTWYYNNSDGTQNVLELALSASSLGTDYRYGFIYTVGKTGKAYDIAEGTLRPGSVDSGFAVSFEKYNMKAAEKKNWEKNFDALLKSGLEAFRSKVSGTADIGNLTTSDMGFTKY